MSEFTAQVTDLEGHISPKAMANQFHTTIKGIATMSGLSIDSVSKRSRVLSRASQTRLQEISLIINRVLPWSGTTFQAYAWFRSEGIPSFGGLTAEQMVKHGKADHVMRYLDRIAEGGFA